LSVYGASKLAGEEAVRSAGGPHLIIRTSWVYAANGTNVLRTITRLGKECKELRIVGDQHGAPTSARLIADVVLSILHRDSLTLADRLAASEGLVNVAASGETTWHGFADAVVAGLKARGLPLATSQYPTKAKRPANSRFNLARLNKVFGITTPDWRVGLGGELDQLAYELGHIHQP
jgi:dTDP-4-dehydrorhamnose reductase